MYAEVENKEERRELKKFNQALEYIRMIAGDSQSPSTALVQSFLAVCLNEGRSLTEIAEGMGQAVSTTSRHLLDLGPRRRDRSPGMGLIDQEVDPMESRRKLYTLTDKGRRLKAQMIGALEE